jgi:multicomponent Na+:H+ antiporter subunit D
MKSHYPALLVVAPLLSAFLVSGLGWLNKRLCFPAALMGSSLSAYCSIGLLFGVIRNGPTHYFLGGWAPPWGIAYRVDGLNGLVLVVVSVLAVANLVATRPSVQKDFPEKLGSFYTLYLLFLTGLMGIVATGDLFNLYVLLEVASLTSYALIAMGGGRAPVASLNYVFMGTIGACFYLLGVGYLYMMTGSLNMADVAARLPLQYESTAVLIGFIFCMVGVWIKMAFFPLHTWLPNAYTHAPLSVSSLIAPLMTKVMAYVMIRLMVSVFSLGFTFQVLGLQRVVIWMASLAILAGILTAMAQKNLKRMLTYVVISEIGYLVGGAWLGNRSGMTGAVLHIVNDALMTLGLFLCAGSIARRMPDLDLKNLRGLFRKMPVTMACLVACGLSIIGVPPTCGFFSKWYLLKGAMEASHFEFLAALLVNSLLSVALFFRIFESAYFEPDHHEAAPAHVRLEEPPLETLVPLVAVSAGLVLVGLYTGDLVRVVIDPILPRGMG